MQFFPGVQSISSLRGPTVVSIGNFDGVHLGHQHILRLNQQKARELKGSSVVYTFRPHPLAALRSEAEVQLLTTYDERSEILASLGVDVLIEEPFGREFSTLGHEEFFNEVLVQRLNARAVVVGYDFAFGRERQGHLEALQEVCARSRVELIVVEPQRLDNEVVSSSRIRELCRTGDLELANRMMGREFCYRDLVSKGDQRGRTLGFPTANLRTGNKLVLPFGVYATWAVWNGEKLPSVTNIGVRPTFKSKSEVLIETHIFDRTLELYGCALEVRFVKQLRREQRFSSVDELVRQMKADSTEARRLLS